MNRVPFSRTPIRQATRPALVNWPVVAFAGVVCLTVMIAGLALALWCGSRMAAPLGEQMDDEAVADVSDLEAIESAEPAFVLETPQIEQVAVSGELAKENDSTPTQAPAVANIPNRPDPVDPFVDESSDAAALPQALNPAKRAAACKQYGTAVNFFDNPTDAAEHALRERKLLFILNVAGNFEDDKFT